MDALRYDFTVPFRSSGPYKERLQFHDALTVFHQTALDKPNNAVLLPFIADPPTTTLQRLKGLTTGTLPTFIDAGSNFAGTAIDEDNIVAQLRAAGKNIVHLGDDTWHSLYPEYFDPELTRSYDSFNVWDLFTVDNGVTHHIFPLLDKSNASRWDVIFGHYLGVDHAGHRYGPDHPAMKSKLAEMNEVFTNMMKFIDDDTLLVVMGDHGMDSKGDHGGESDDEVEAALWMYSKRPLFGRLSPAHNTPPTNAKERPVRQIDLVPTLSLLLGIPIPFNNLGRPIDEAFVSKSGADFPNLAKVNRLAAAQIHRYQQEYAKVRNIDSAATANIDRLWSNAQSLWAETRKLAYPPIGIWSSTYQTFAEYQKKNLELCRDLWARFDDFGIIMGIQALAISFFFLAVFARGLKDERNEVTTVLLKRGFGYGALGGAIGFVLHKLIAVSLLSSVASGSVVGGLLGVGSIPWPTKSKYYFVSKSLSTWTSAVAVLLLCIGFAANSFTIWEDDILLFFLMTIGFFLAASCLRQSDPAERLLGVTQSAVFIACTRAASLSRLCREEQMPYCKSTYYASATSSTSSWWQLMIPLFVAALLPDTIRSGFKRSQNYHGSAVLWLGIALRLGLTLIVLYWILDASDDNEWLPNVDSATLKSSKMVVAQIVLALGFAAGYATYIYATPFINIEQREAAPPTAQQQTTSSQIVDPSNPTSDVFTTLAPPPQQSKPQILIYGYANTFGTRSFLLVTIWILPLLLLSKPMGQGALSLQIISLLALFEALDCSSSLRHTALGPIVLALSAQFHFFKTGHQAALSSIQWESAFIPLREIKYPWSPLLVILNTFAPLFVATAALPALTLWKLPPRTSGREILEHVARDTGTFVSVFAAWALATAAEAAWLRRHLMLYRVFMPRMLLATTSLLVVDVFVLVGPLLGTWWAVGSVAEVFGWG